MHQLNINTTLCDGKYRILQVLGQGSFGITYQAEHMALHKIVAIKEFFMKEINSRDGSGSVTGITHGSLAYDYAQKFQKEASNLASIDHPNIVRVTDSFAENNTYYYVMDYIDGENLNDYIQTHSLSEQEVIDIISKVAVALQYMHEEKHMLHLDLKPGNIMRRKSDGHIFLIDFGLSKHFSENGQPETSTTIGLGTAGYAPLEQSNQSKNGEFLPTIDVYALGATAYKLLTSETPPEPKDIVFDDGELLKSKLGRFSSSLRSLILHAMEIRPKQRTQTVRLFLSELYRPSSVTSSEGEVTISNPLKDQTFTVNGVSFKMIAVEGGTFMMGAGGKEALDKEKPIHTVSLSSFYIGQTTVTQELWEAVMGSNPSKFKGDNQRPVERVSWDDCQVFVAQLNNLLSNKLCGKRFRLPTEAEWEFAARGGNKSRGYKYSGSNNLSDVAWYYKNSGTKLFGFFPKTCPVKQKQANELGLYDMTGNVYEWCQDWFGDYSSNPQTNPTGASHGSLRVLRGGAWYSYAKFCRSSNRFFNNPKTRIDYFGFRLVLSEEGLEQSETKNKEGEQTCLIEPKSQEQTFNVNGVPFKMVHVEGGTFTMGATSEQGSDAYNNEKPTHSVTLTSFSIGETAVTQALWQAVMGNNPSYFTGNNQRPVEDVSWNDCQTFINKLNNLLSDQLGGKRFRLPTEAEWEFAARGGNKSRGYKYSGSNDLNSVAWYEENSGEWVEKKSWLGLKTKPVYENHKTHPVKQKQPNELGLYDMSGNVQEWCQDWYGSYSSSSQTNPTGPSSGSYRMCCGGSWCYDARHCRSSYRNFYDPDYLDCNLGLRFALSE